LGAGTIVKVAHCNDIRCDTNNVNLLADAAGTTAQQCQSWTAVVRGVDGYPLVAYHDCDGDDTNVNPLLNGDLRVVHCSNSHCIPWTSH
jgi:hypothetical protein